MEEPKLGTQKQERKSAFFESSKTLIVRMGGWVDGDQKGRSILLNFKCRYNRDVLILITGLNAVWLY